MKHTKECFAKKEGELEMKQRYDAKQTKEEILFAAGQLFNAKGYKQTSIQDIVEELDGLSKGAIYHHFKSKEAILDELMRHFMPSEEIIESVREDNNLNGLEKIQKLFLQGMFHEEVQKYLGFSPELIKEPVLSLKYLKLTQAVFIPVMSEFIEEGNQDGSISVPHPQLIAEVVLFLLTTWYSTTLFDSDIANFYQKLETSQYVLEKIGVNVLDESVIASIQQKIIERTEELQDEESTKN